MIGLPSVETLTWVWVLSWSSVTTIAAMLIVMGWQTVRALIIVGERRRAYHVWARGSLLRRSTAFVLGVMMTGIGCWSLYAQKFTDDPEAFLEDTNFGQWFLLGISLVGPLIALKLFTEWHNERVLLQEANIQRMEQD